MLDRRSFIQQVAVSLPAVTVLSSLTKGAETPAVVRVSGGEHTGILQQPIPLAGRSFCRRDSWSPGLRSEPHSGPPEDLAPA